MCPRLFTIGSFSLPTYGLLVALGFLLGITLAGKLARRTKVDPTHVSNLGVYLALSAIVGAKVFLILANWRYYSGDWSRLFSLSALQAGGVFYGGLLGALLTAFLYTRKYHLPGLLTADIFAPAVAAGHAVGRLGCFAAGCCWGRETDVPWAVVFSDPFAHQNTGVPLGLHVHPTQLYESFGTALIAFYLYRYFQKSHPPGAVIGRYLILYSSFRFVVEFFRDNAARPMIFDDGLSATQWTAVFLILGGIAILMRNRGQTPGGAARQAG